MAISYMSSAYPPGWDKQQLEKLLAEARAKEARAIEVAKIRAASRTSGPKVVGLKAGLKTGGLSETRQEKRLNGLNQRASTEWASIYGMATTTVPSPSSFANMTKEYNDSFLTFLDQDGAVSPRPSLEEERIRHKVNKVFNKLKKQARKELAIN
jgi:hypothetical protein